MPEICNFCLRIRRNTGIIAQFREIAETGDLPAGFHWQSIQWREGHGWMGWVVGPNGCNDWIRCKQIPKEIMEELYETS